MWSFKKARFNLFHFLRLENFLLITGNSAIESPSSYVGFYLVSEENKQEISKKNDYLQGTKRQK